MIEKEFGGDGETRVNTLKLDERKQNGTQELPEQHHESLDQGGI